MCVSQIRLSSEACQNVILKLSYGIYNLQNAYTMTPIIENHVYGHISMHLLFIS